MRLLILGIVACSPARVVVRAPPPPPPAEPAEPPIAVAAALERELAAGLTSQIDVRVPGAGGALVGHCTITYDLWNGAWDVERDGVRRSFRDRAAGLASCVDRGALQRARDAALANRERFELTAEPQPLELGLGIRGHDTIWCGGVDDRLIRTVR